MVVLSLAIIYHFQIRSGETATARTATVTTCIQVRLKRKERKKNERGLRGTKLAFYSDRQTPRPRKTCYISEHRSHRWFSRATPRHERTDLRLTMDRNGRSRSSVVVLAEDGPVFRLQPHTTDHVSSKRFNRSFEF